MSENDLFYYCELCRGMRGYPFGTSKAIGKCGVCQRHGLCHVNLASRILKTGFDAEIQVGMKKAEDMDIIKMAPKKKPNAYSKSRKRK